MAHFSNFLEEENLQEVLHFVQSSDACLDFGRDYLVLLDFLVKGTAGDPEPFGRLLDPPSLFIQHSLDVLLFKLQECQACIQEWRSHSGMAVEVEVLEPDAFLVTQEHCSFDNITQLTNVAGP